MRNRMSKISGKQLFIYPSVAIATVLMFLHHYTSNTIIALAGLVFLLLPIPFISLEDVFFNPSVQETFGLVSGEALACGTPVVVYDTTACPEFVSDNTGVIMKNKNDIVDAIKKVLDKTNEVGRKKIAQECVDFVKNNFDLDTNIKKYIDLFESTL